MKHLFCNSARGIAAKRFLVFLCVTWTILLSVQSLYAQEEDSPKVAPRSATELESEPEESSMDVAPLSAPPPPSDEETTSNKESEDEKISIPTISALTHRWATGVNFAWQSRRDYGARYYRRFAPEVLGYIYGETPFNSIFWRGGLRLGYSSDQPEMPQAVRIEESDTTVLFEGGLVKNWVVVPSLAFGYGCDFRTTKVKTKPPLDSIDDRLNRKERLAMWYVQTGLGIPIHHGTFMIEPTLRYHSVDFDDRSQWTIGFEWTVGF